VDVLRAVANGSPNVTGIEINPLIATTVMRKRYAGYAYHLYELPEVHIHVTDGRSFIRNSREQYDVIQMTLVDTWASTAAGAFALSENSLYTADAFREYFQHLKPDGMIAITRWEFRQPREALRVVSVAMEALHQLGVTNPARNFMVASDGDLDEDGIPVVVLAKKSPFTPAEEDAAERHIERNDELNLLYLPSDPGQNPFSALIARNDPWAFARAYPYNVAPVNDNAPFFFFTLKTGQILNEESLHQGIDWKVNLGVVVLGMVLVISLAAVLAFLILPMLLGAGGPSRRRVSLLYFIAVGLGYILVEIAFIQRFVLFLGHPTYALTVVIFLLLLASGAGSLMSRRWLREPGQVWLPLLLLAAAISLYVVVLPSALRALVGLPFVLKLPVSGLLLIPLGVAMGMPFPTGLRALDSSAEAEAAAHASSGGATGVSPVPPGGAPGSPLNYSVLRVGNRTGQLFHSPSREDLLKLPQERVMHQSIRRQRFAAGDLERATREVRDLPARLFHNQHARRRVPRIEIEFPESVKSARRHIAQIQRGRPGPPHPVGAQGELVIEINIGVLVPLMTGETGSHQALSQFRRHRHVNCCVVQPRAATELSGEHLVASWIVNHSRDPLPMAFHGQRNAKHWKAVRKIRCAIQRIDIPLVFAARFDARSLFPNHVMSRKLVANPFQNQRLRLAIRDRNQIHVALVFNLHVLPKVVHEQAARLASHGLHRRNQIQRLKGCHESKDFLFQD
jgi:hypothetical protein